LALLLLLLSAVQGGLAGTHRPLQRMCTWICTSALYLLLFLALC
jgi:hypothetical protein